MPKKCILYLLLYSLTGVMVVLSVIAPRPNVGIISWYVGIALVLNLLTSVSTMKCLALLIIAPWQRLFLLRQEKHFPLTATWPLISVLIPAWNEEVGLVSTVKTVLNSSYPNVEIIVVNDGSTDRSDFLMRAFLWKYNRAMDGRPQIPIHYFYQPNGGKGSALNTAISLSHGSILVSIDADCVMDQGCLSALAIAFFDPQVMAVSGCIKIGNRKTLLGVVQSMEYALSLYARQADTLLDTIYVVGGACGAFRREVFQQIGGYVQKHITEDLDISMRIRRAGMRIAYAPDAVVYTEGATSLAGLIKQRVRWVQGRFKTFSSYRDLLFSRQQRHNKVLSWFFLPLVVANDWSAALRIGLRLGLYIYYILSGTFPIIALSAFFALLIILPALLADRDYRRIGWIAPIAWVLFLIPSSIEIYAVLRTLWGMLRKREAVWQKWQRKGVFDTVKK